MARGIRGVEGRSRFTTWLYPVVANTAFATYRRLRRTAEDAGLDHAPDVVDPYRAGEAEGRPARAAHASVTAERARAARSVR